MSIYFVIEGKDKYVIMFRSKFRTVEAFRLFGGKVKDLNRQMKSSHGPMPTKEARRKMDLPEEA
jgi:hypothetical protein